MAAATNLAPTAVTLQIAAAILLLRGSTTRDIHRVMQVTDLSIEAFKILRQTFFRDDLTPIEFELRDKRNTQDDPFDEYVADVLERSLPEDVKCHRAPGPLITPDIALTRPHLCNGAPRDQLSVDLTRMVGIEVKKLERGKDGKVARASGLDYNSTPPCGTIRVYDADGRPMDMRGFYLFACLDRGKEAKVNYLSSLVLCDGNALNSDFEYYLSVAGQRTKEIGVGTYGDGANRNRPMVIFSNPLGSSLLDRNATLLHPRSDLADIDAELSYAGRIRRSIPGSKPVAFHCYRKAGTPPSDFDATDPFPSPKKRSEKTTGRGRFKINVKPAR